LVTPLSSRKKGLAFSDNLGRNIDNAAKRPLSLNGSLRLLEVVMLSMGSHLSRLASIPLWVIIKSKKILFLLRRHISLDLDEGCALVLEQKILK